MTFCRRVFAAALACASHIAFGDEPAVELGRVEVVGSRISRADSETALPVQIIRREEIERSGVQTTEELLARVSANTNAWTDAVNIGNDAKPGFSGAALRGLASSTTLVLLNGRRLANYAFSAADIGVDLHTIPLAAIERVEILKDGASALYGSDAIAGVINFVTRSDYQGAELQASAGTSEAGGGAQVRTVLTLGHGNAARDGYNVVAVIEQRHESGLAGRDRAFSATSYRPLDGLDRTSSSAFPGNVFVGNRHYVNPAAPACTDITVLKNGGCFYDYARQVADVAPLTSTSVLGRGTLRLGADHEAFAEVLYETHRALYRISATPINAAATNGIVEIDVPTTSPYYPTGLGLAGDIADVRYRTVTLGPRTSESRSDNERAVVGMKGRVDGWDYDTGVAVAASHAHYNLVSGYVDSQALASAFGTGLIDPFASTPAGDALLASTQVRAPVRHATGITRTLDGHASRELLQLPAGPLALAIGGEWRRETLDDIEAPVAQSIAGGEYNPPKSGSRDVRAVFAELNVPIFKSLEALLAVRADHYDDFGTTWNPKVALRWQPARSVVARASVGTGFRAPSLPELYTAQGSALFSPDGDLGDTARCPVTHLDSDCDPLVPVRYGGNPKLQPVRSTQASVGVVFEPSKHWNGSIDYWRVSLRHDIGSLDPNAIFADPATYGGNHIVRGPVDPAFPGLPGPIVAVDTYLENLGRTETSGFDLRGGYRSNPSALGRFSAQIDGTLVTRWTQQLDGVHDSSSLGAFVNGVAVPRWKHELSFGWDSGPYTVTAAQSFRTGYVDENPLPDGSLRRVASYTLWNAQLADALTKDFMLRIGVKNLFNRDPPFSNQDFSFQPGYDPTYTDPRGRFWYVSASIRFR